MDYQFIASDKALAEFCGSIADATCCAIDTEFVREKTYYPIFALLQIATEQRMACIDPFAIEDFSPLQNLLQSTGLTKVFHASRQDLEVLFQQFGTVPSCGFRMMTLLQMIQKYREEQVGEPVSDSRFTIDPQNDGRIQRYVLSR